MFSYSCAEKLARVPAFLFDFVAFILIPLSTARFRKSLFESDMAERPPTPSAISEGRPERVIPIGFPSAVRACY